MKNRSYKIITAIFSFLLILFILAAFIVVVEVSSTQKNGITIVQKDGNTDSRVQVEIKPRGGVGDSWEKLLVNDPNEKKINGITYSCNINSEMEDEIPDWTLRIDIEQEVWLNNAWCGTMEVHQGNNEQELDLRSVNPSKIVLDKLDDPDILIPLEPGDYVIYHPSQKEYEMPIAPNGFKEIGFIFYSNQEDPIPAFSSVTLKCNPSSAYANKASVQVLIGLGIIWAISAIALVVFIIQMRRSEKMLRTQQELVEQTMQTISSFVDAKDEYTAGHSNRVASVARIIARRLGYGAEEQRQVYYCGLLHDSGKVGIPDGILNKPGKLTDDEFSIIKTHSVIGYQMLEKLSLVSMAATAARNHHERWDGAGYPDGLAAEEIPEVARILCVADAFDAMSSTRVYRQAMDREYILGQFETYRGSQFDPRMVDAFLEAVSDGEIVV